jgi:hypothetical protein
VIQLQAPDGHVLVEAEDHVENVALPANGTYTIMLGYRNQGSIDENGLLPFTAKYSLVLEWSSQAGADQRLQADLTPGTRATGTLPDKAVWTFAGSAGQTITVDVESGDFDSQIRLLNLDGELLTEDDDSGEGMSAQVTFTLPETGIYTIEISSWNDKVGAYRVEVRDAEGT